MMDLADLKDDGDYKLLTVDYKTSKLKIFMGTNVLYTASVGGKPTAIQSWYPQSKKPMIPLIAIASEH